MVSKLMDITNSKKIPTINYSTGSVQVNHKLCLDFTNDRNPLNDNSRHPFALMICTNPTQKKEIGHCPH